MRRPRPRGTRETPDPFFLGGDCPVCRPAREVDAEPDGSPTLWVVVDDEVRYVLDEPHTRAWRQVLRRVDGDKPLGVLLQELDLSLLTVRKDLEEALEFDVVAFAR
jgi:hypothetical protein